MKIHEIKAIVESEFYVEMHKHRGERINEEVRNALQTIGIEIEKKIKRLNSGEDVHAIINA